MTERERLKVLGALCITAVAAIVICVIAFFQMSKNGAVEKLTTEKIAVGTNHVLVVDDAGDVYAFGHNALGELGDVTCDNKSEAVKAEVPGKVVQVAAGEELSFALNSKGDLYAWGDNTSYQMGDGMNISRMEPEQMASDIAQIAVGDKHALAIGTDGALYVWGRNKNGALGIADNACDQTDEDGYACQSTPYKLMDNVVSISAGLNYSMAVTADGTLYAWGDGEDSQLGLTELDSTNDNDESYQSVPAKVMDGVSRVICGGRYQALALTESGDLYCWGKNRVGSIGIPNAECSDAENGIQTTPLKIMENVTDVSAGTAHTIALTADGTAYVWGLNNYGQIGIAKGDNATSIGEETVYYQQEPRAIAENVQAIGAGGFETMYSKGGVLYSVGCNLYGQLGIGSTEDKITSPHAVYLKK